MERWQRRMRAVNGDRPSAPDRRFAMCASVSAAAVLLLLAGTQTMAGAAGAAPRAHAAASLSVKDEGKLHLRHSSGSTLYDEGSAHGTLPGTVKVRFTYDGNPNVAARITVYAHRGSITAQGSARLSNAASSAPSFKGTIAIVSGTGRYAHAHGTGHLYGVFYRRSYALTVQTEGTMHY